MTGWYKAWSHIDSIRPDGVNGPDGIRSTPMCIQEEIIQEEITKEWDLLVSTQKKLEFYSSIKMSYGEELYLASTDFRVRRAIARIRSSAHDLNIERGRYKVHKQGHRILDRLCRFCCLNEEESSEVLLLMEHLPFYEPILETEHHVLTECPAYHHIRYKLSEDLKSLIMCLEYGTIMEQPSLIDEFGVYLIKCYNLRHPHKKR